MRKIFLYRFTELFRLIRLLGCGELDKSGIMGKIVPDHSTFGKHNSISKPNVTGGDVAAAVQQRKAIAAMVNVARLIAGIHIIFWGSLSIEEFTKVAPQGSCPQSVRVSQRKLTERIDSAALFCTRLWFQRTARTHSIRPG